MTADHFEKPATKTTVSYTHAGKCSAGKLIRFSLTYTDSSGKHRCQQMVVHHPRPGSCEKRVGSKGSRATGNFSDSSLNGDVGSPVYLH